MLLIYKDGNYELTDQELTQRFDPGEIMLIEKFNSEKKLSQPYMPILKGNSFMLSVLK